jgi:antitoxin component YwqK of YwqJK toxin-antitoxin module
METKIERTYWSNGNLHSETPYVNGVWHGIRKRRWSSGQLGSEMPYVGGMLHGMAKGWSPNGDIEWFRLYNQGEYVAKFFPRNKTQRWKLK